jgi:hypothetical protein
MTLPCGEVNPWPHDEHTQFWQERRRRHVQADMEGFHFVLENASRVARSHERLTKIFRTVPELHASRTRDAGTAGKQIANGSAVPAASRYASSTRSEPSSVTK